MKLEVNQKGARADGKLIAKGTVLEIKGDTIPASLVGKVAIINPVAVSAEKDDAPKTAKEALALFSAEGVHANKAKAIAAKFLGDKVPADASKDVIVAKLEELAKSE